MQVRNLTNVSLRPNLYTVSNKRNISFGDDCGYVPDWYRPSDAMKDMKNKGYVIQGINTKDAFDRLYNDVNCELNLRASMPDAVWIKEYQSNAAYQDNRKIKYTVHNMSLEKEDFSSMLTRFWQKNKNNAFNDVKGTVTDFLTNTEGMKKPNFFQMFMAKFANYIEKQTILTDVVKCFLKEGRHRLM